LNKDIESLRKEYMDIQIPKELGQAISKGILRGEADMKSRRNKSWLKSIAAAAVIIIGFTISVNTMPAFAKSMIEVPVLGSLVKMITFSRVKDPGGTLPNENVGTGGQITDGKDIYSVDYRQEGEEDKIVVTFKEGEQDSKSVPHYKISYSTHPYTMIFEVSGVRYITAAKSFEDLKGIGFIKDVYQIVTYDDSMHRFAMVFNDDIKYEAQEYQSPAQIVINLAKGQSSHKEDIYSVRSASYPQPGPAASLEETFFKLSSRRILRDEKGQYLLELGHFVSQQEAQDFIKSLEANLEPHQKLYIEKRAMGQTPGER